MPRKPKGIRNNSSHKPQSLPAKFRAGFLAELDGRTDLAKALRANHDAILSDIGDGIGHIKGALIERFCWLEAILTSMEHEIATGAADKGELIGKWIQGCNALQGLAKVLGIERREHNPWNVIDAASRNGAAKVPLDTAAPTNGHAPESS